MAMASRYSPMARSISLATGTRWSMMIDSSLSKRTLTTLVACSLPNIKSISSSKPSSVTSCAGFNPMFFPAVITAAIDTFTSGFMLCTLSSAGCAVFSIKGFSAVKTSAYTPKRCNITCCQRWYLSEVGADFSSSDEPSAAHLEIAWLLSPISKAKAASEANTASSSIVEVSVSR